MMTGVGMLLGTAPYMSPEQAKGRDADRRSDAWAFGCVLFEMLSGKRAFDGEDASDTLATVLKGEPAWAELPADVPQGVRTLIRRCLEKDRRRRIGDVATALLVVDDQTVPAPVLTRRRIPARLLLPAAAAALTVTGLAAYAGWSLKPEAEARVPHTWEHSLPAGHQFSSQGRHLIAVAPTGSHVVYVANDRLYKRAMDRLEPEPIMGTEEGRGPFFSADGRWIGFWARNRLWRVAMTGGAPVEIAEIQNPTGASWGQDDVIVYAQAGQGVWQVPWRGGTPKQIVALEKNELAQSPQLLPGNRVLFTIASGGNWDTARVYVQHLETRQRTFLAEGIDGRYLAATGHLIYVLSGTLFGVTLNLDTLDMSAGSGPVPLRDGIGEAVQGLSGAAHFGVADDGTLAYVPADGFGTAVFRRRVPVWVDREGRETTLPGAEPRVYVYPRLSPDDTKIAFDVRDRENDIYLWNGGSLQNLTHGALSDQYPLWLDDRSIVYSSGTSAIVSQPRTLYRISLDGRPSEVLLKSDVAVYPLSVLPGGALVVRSAQPSGGGGGIGRLTRLSPGSDRLERLFMDDGNAQMPNAEISPSGNLIAYQSDAKNNRFEIFVRSYPDEILPETQVTFDGGTRPLWSHKGGELFYEANGTLMRVTVAKGPTGGPTFGPPQRVLEARYFFGSGGAGGGGTQGRTYDISKDDSRFLMLKDVPDDTNLPEWRPRVVVIQQWTDELATRVRGR
jgi:serine/threonine-protein kinase